MDRSLSYRLIGDSSLYTKRANRKKSFISTLLRDTYRFKNLTENIFPGGGVKEMLTYLEHQDTDVALLQAVDVLGISYFGNEHTVRRLRDAPHPYDLKTHRDLWNGVFKCLREKVRKRVVFFVGGFAAKYSCSRVYDENMDTIKKWIKHAGFQVVEAKQEVDSWQLASDKLHFTVECLPELAAFWNNLLVPRKFVQPGKRLRKAQDQRSDPPAPTIKRARDSVCDKDPRDKWLLPAKRRRCSADYDDDDLSSEERTKGLERAARLERDKKKLKLGSAKLRGKLRARNDELAMRRAMLLKAEGTSVPEAPRRPVPPRPAPRR